MDQERRRTRLLLFGAGAVFLVVIVIAALASTSSKQRSEDVRPSPAPIRTAAPSPSPTPTESPVTPQPVASVNETTLASPANRSALLSELHVAPEHARTGYDRDLFHLWLDADHDGCNTRREVLIRDSLTPVTEGPSCAIEGGKWYSRYDGVTTTDSSTFDIDHVVPLAEAWDSGAWDWPGTERDAYANDLGWNGSLLAVTAGSNRSKGDADPSGWEPPLQSDDCDYATDWIEIKVRWSLTADANEVASLRSMLATCGAQPFATVPPAPVFTPVPSTATAAPKGNCAASYPDFCIPPPPPDLDCADVSGRNFTVLWNVPDPDPHGFDHDHDGKGCES